MNAMLTQGDIRNILRHRCEAAGSQSAWARANGVKRQYVSQVLAGKQRPGAAILRALGYEARISYLQVPRAGA